jgi:copper chaperone CopZ
MGILASISASLCCITPVLGVLGGISGLASTFSWLEPYRPYLISLTTLVLGFAWYKKLKPRIGKVVACECETDNNKKPSFLQSKTFLGIVTLLAGMLLAFPYYSNIFFGISKKDTVIVEKENIAFVKIEIIGMTCAGCEESVNKAITSLSGVLDVKSNHKTGFAKIKYDKSKVDTNDFKNVIENNIGYTISNITKGE